MVAMVTRVAVLAIIMVVGVGVWGAEGSAEDVLCPLCMDAVSDIEAGVATNATESEIVAALSKVCDLVPSGEKRAKCETEFAGLAPLLNSSDESVLVKYTPREVCGWPRLCSFDCCTTPYTPEQIHLSLGPSVGTMRVTWVTLLAMDAPVCKWGSAQGVYPHSAPASSLTYDNGGWVGVVHTCLMTGLVPGDRVFYTVGSGEHSYWDHPNWAQPKDLSFAVPLAPGKTAPGSKTVYAQYADMGAMDASDKTMARLSELVLDSKLDFILHSGDIGYADGAEAIWDEFGRKIEIVSGYIPYQVAKGNHEVYYYGEPMYTRYPGPSSGWTENGADGMYYSFSYGHVKMIVLDSENDFGLAPDLHDGGKQRAWLEAELAAANTPQARAEHPWVVVTMHRPMYCPSHSTDCTEFAPLFRDALEDLFLKYDVDLHHSGHRHSYSRTTSIYQSKVMPPGSAPVYVVCGVGGSKEGPSGGFPPTPQPWSAFHAEDWGFLLVEANATVLTGSYVSAYTGAVLDSFDLVKAHG